MIASSSVEAVRDQHPRVRELVHDLAAGVDAVLVGHDRVHDDDVGLQALRGSHCLCAVCGLPDHLEVFLAVERVAAGHVPHDGVVGPRSSP